MERRNSPEATQSGLLASWRHKPWLMLGIGYYFAFSLSVVINCPSLIVGQEWFYSMLLVRGSFSATISISLIVMMFLIRKIDILGSGRWAIAFFVGLTSIGTILLILALNYVDSVELMLTSTLLIGIGNSVLLLSWGALFQKLSLNRLAGHVTLSCLFAAVACVAIRALPPAAYFAAAVTLPLASGITLILCADEQHKAEEPEVMWENGLTKILVCCIIMGLTCGLLRVFPVFGETFALHADAIYASIVLIFVLNAILVVLVGRKNPVLFLYRFCMPVFIAGYGLLVTGNPLTNVLAIACALGGSVLFECLVLLVFPYVAFKTKGSVIHLLGWCVAAQHTGSFVGFLLGEFSAAREIANQAQMAAFSLLAVIAFMCLFFFIFKELDVINITEKKSGDPVRVVQTAGDRLLYLAEAYRLSPREAEVLKLLSNGRSLPYIEEELVISHSTARTHVKHIYDKLGVNSRQQLHDLVQGEAD